MRLGANLSCYWCAEVESRVLWPSVLRNDWLLERQDDIKGRLRAPFLVVLPPNRDKPKLPRGFDG